MLLTLNKSSIYLRLALILALFCTFFPSPVKCSRSNQPLPSAREASLPFCGYDPTGADDEWLRHTANESRRSFDSLRASASNSSELTVTDLGDTAVIIDDGSIVIPANQFDLKGRSVVFIPADDGYRVSRDNIEFSSNMGTRLSGFVSSDGQSPDADDGYVGVDLNGPSFTFFGKTYDRIFIGTNGYITFDRGDTTARVSPSLFASDLPRISPLWVDLDAGSKGKIAFNRLEDRYLITWNKIFQPVFGGNNTFQVSLFDDGRIAFVYKKAKPRAALAGISPGGASGSMSTLRSIDMTSPPGEIISGPVCEVFSEQKRLDLPALTRAFYSAHPDDFDTVYIWTDFAYDNGLGVAHEFNVQNDIQGIGLELFDRSQLYGSSGRLFSIITMGNSTDWPADPQQNTAGLNSAVAIVCHEQGHRWLSYVQAQGGHGPQDILLGRDQSHWSFFMDTRTRPDGVFSSLMEGNSWEGGNGVFTTSETAVNYFSSLDQYLMGLRSADEVGAISYQVTDQELTAILQEKSPLSGFSVNSNRKQISLQKIIDLEGVRVPDATTSRKDFRAAFVLLVEAGKQPSNPTVAKMADYASALERYFSVATSRRASLSTSLQQ